MGALSYYSAQCPVYHDFPAWSWGRAGLCYLCSSLPLSTVPVLSSEHELLRTQENPQVTLSRSPGFSLVYSFLAPCPVNFICLWFPGPAVPSPQQGVYCVSWPPHSCTTGQKLSLSLDWGNQMTCLICFPVTQRSLSLFPFLPHHIQCLKNYCSSFWLSHVGG